MFKDLKNFIDNPKKVSRGTVKCEDAKILKSNESARKNTKDPSRNSTLTIKTKKENIKKSPIPSRDRKSVIQLPRIPRSALKINPTFGRPDSSDSRNGLRGEKLKNSKSSKNKEWNLLSEPISIIAIAILLLIVMYKSKRRK